MSQLIGPCVFVCGKECVKVSVESIPITRVELLLDLDPHALY